MPGTHEQDHPDLRQAAATSKEALKFFWHFLDAHFDAIQDDVRGVLSRLPGYSKLAPAATPVFQDPKVLEARRDQQRRALLEADWAPYQAYLNGAGKQFAQSGMAFEEFTSFFHNQRRAVSRRIKREAAPASLELIQEGFEIFLGMAAAFMGEGFLLAKQDTIRQQEQTLRELSTPILQLRDRLLLLPLIGTVDNDRARQATADMLAAIRQTTARAIIIDVTGVPMVDSHVALSFSQASTTARLMGAMVILTGISTETARSLVALGVGLKELKTYSNLQKGLEAAEVMLGRVG